MAFAPDDSSLLSDQDTNQFWCRRGLNPRSLIQPSETLSVELTRIYYKHISYNNYKQINFIELYFIITSIKVLIAYNLSSYLPMKFHLNLEIHKFFLVKRLRTSEFQ